MLQTLFNNQSGTIEYNIGNLNKQIIFHSQIGNKEDFPIVFSLF